MYIPRLCKNILIAYIQGISEFSRFRFFLILCVLEIFFFKWSRTLSLQHWLFWVVRVVLVFETRTIWANLKVSEGSVFLLRDTKCMKSCLFIIDLKKTLSACSKVFVFYKLIHVETHAFPYSSTHTLSSYLETSSILIRKPK